MNNIGEEVTRLYAKELAIPKKNMGTQASTATGIVAVVFALLVLSIGFAFVHYWTKYIYLQQAIYAQESRIEKELQRRANLQTKLIAIATEYARHERVIFKYISDARVLKKSAEKLESALSPTKGAEVGKTLSKLMALAEQYPDLKATKSFQLLMEMNEITEDRIASTRDKYIALTREYNAGLQSFPDNMFNLFLRFKKMEFYRVEEDTNPAPQIHNMDLFKEEEGKQESHEPD